MTPTVTVYSDGGCRPNPGVGAWAAILECKGHQKEIVGGELETTNNRMELMGAIRAFESLKKTCIVRFHTDSEYVKRGVTEWMDKWKRQRWRRGSTLRSAPVKNVDLWQRLDEAIQPHSIDWNWVRGHAGDPMNERCDELCTREIDRLYILKQNAPAETNAPSSKPDSLFSWEEPVPQRD